VNTIIWRGEGGEDECALDPLPEMPDYLKQVIEGNEVILCDSNRGLGSARAPEISE